MMAVGMLPGMTRKAKATAPDVGISWDSDNNRYVISNYAGLVEFANIVNGTGSHAGNANRSACAVISDEVDSIDASASASADSSWTPIGKDTSLIYTGTFDGNGKEITRLTIDNDSTDYIGLFGIVGPR